MSPIEGRTFSYCILIKNIQLLTDFDRVNKYVCKYIVKIDKKYYVVIYVKNRGQISTKKNLTKKVATSKTNKDKTKENIIYRASTRGRIIIHTKMLQNMLKYAIIFTDFKYIKSSTSPIKLRSGVY